MKKKLYTAGTAFILAFFLHKIVLLFFQPALSAELAELREKQTVLIHSQKVLTQKELYGAEWERHKDSFVNASGSEAVLNQWVKELLAYSSSQGLVLTKLEPQGKRKSKSGEEVRLYLAFQGDISKLAGLLYHLREKDPLSSVESFVMKKEEEPGRFLYEMVLGRVMK